MTIWTPKADVGIKSQWAPQKDGRWDESNILVYSTQIKQERIIHLENVYRYMWHYFSEEGWNASESIGDVDDNKRYEVFFGEYRDSQGHKEIRFWWRMQKNCGGIAGVHNYFLYKVYVDVLTTNMKRIEMTYKGKKIKPYVGEFILWFNSILVLDRNGWFKKDGPLSVFADFFPRMIYKDRIREQEIELRRFSERFIEDLKFFIGLNRLNAVRQPLEPEKEWF
ncbi:MAG: hypothetical protein QXE31_05795 [Candidatus Woesearchaeota archaeon]